MFHLAVVIPFVESVVFVVVQLFCDPMDCSLTGSSVHRISQARILEYWSGSPFPLPGDLPDSGIETMSHVLAGRFLTVEPPGKLQ